MSLKVFRCGALAAALACGSASAQSMPDWAVGNVESLSTLPSGIIIRFEGGVVPQNCVNAPYQWMFIPNSSGAMVSLILGRWLNGRRALVVYTDPTSSGFCSISQAAAGD